MVDEQDFDGGRFDLAGRLDDDFVGDAPPRCRLVRILSGRELASDEGTDLVALADAEIARGIERIAVLGEGSNDLVAERLREFAQLRQRGFEFEIGHVGQVDRSDRCQLGCFEDVDRHAIGLSR